LPDYFKLILTRRYFQTIQSLIILTPPFRYLLRETESQSMVAGFIAGWLNSRVPVLTQFYSKGSGKQEDNIHRVLTLNKEMEILHMILDEQMDFYNYRISKNTADIEVRNLE